MSSPHVPTVTGIIGTYNRAELLRDAIDSVLKQTCQDWELLVVDNGSTDQTRTVVAGYRDARVRYILNGTPTGSCAAPRNIGIQQARGRYLAFLDDDDVWYPDKLAVCVRELEAHPDAALVCHAQRVVQDGRFVTVSVWGPWSPDMYERLLYERNCLSPGAVVIRTEVLRRIGGFDVQEAYLGCDDYDLWIRLARTRARFHFIGDVLAEFRITGFNGSISDPYHAIRMAEMVKTNILLFENSRVLSRRGRARMAVVYAFVARTFLRFGKWRESFLYVRKALSCGLPGLRRIAREVLIRLP